MYIYEFYQWLIGKSERKSIATWLREFADRSDARAKMHNIDPPCPGRKTYMERYAETNAMSTDQLHQLRDQRIAQGKEVGVTDHVLSTRY